MTREDRFLLVVEANKGIIYKVATAYCKDGEDRKDLVQEIMVQLWKSLDHYNEQFKQSTWMYRIALNVAISFYRKTARRKTITIPLELSDTLDIEAIDSTETPENISLLHKFLAELTELDRALMLLYLDEKSHQQMADILGISTSNVATKISRIKERIKQKFSTQTYH